MRPLIFELSLLSSLVELAFGSSQTPLKSPLGEQEYWKSPHPIRSVAIIGAGPAGLQTAAALAAEAPDIAVRLFDRAPAPGGNWFYSEELPARETYPSSQSKPVELPSSLPTTYFHHEREGGVSLDERWREHWAPRPVWHEMKINSAMPSTTLPGVGYPPGTPWQASVHAVQRHVRAYASLHALNVLDSPNVTSYATRVDALEKRGDSWVLSLRRMQPFSGTEDRLRVDVWEESFDAVVLAMGVDGNAYIPDIPGINAWSRVRREDGHWPLHHSQSFRHVNDYVNKTVLIVGASVSATGIARELGPHVKRLLLSSLPNPIRDAYGLDILFGVPSNAERFGEIIEFTPLLTNLSDIRQGKIHVRLFENTTATATLEGIDEIILATGYRLDSFVTDLLHPQEMSNLHWTGHYLHDPTLAYVHCTISFPFYSECSTFSSARPWTHGRYQCTSIARVWRDPPTARLPSQAEMWADYREGKWNFGMPLDVLPQEALMRMYVAWLNSEALELGGRMIAPIPLEDREINTYFTSLHWRKDWFEHEKFERFDKLPSSEWPEPGPF